MFIHLDLIFLFFHRGILTVGVILAQSLEKFFGTCERKRKIFQEGVKFVSRKSDHLGFQWKNLLMINDEKFC